MKMKKFKMLLLAAGLMCTTFGQCIPTTFVSIAATTQKDEEKDNDNEDTTSTGNVSNTPSKVTESPLDNPDNQPQNVATNEVNIDLLDTWKTPVATYGQTVNIILPLVNLGTDNLKDIIVSPEISTSTEEFPFEIEKTSYNVYINDLPGTDCGLSPVDRRREVTYTFKTRENVSSGYQRLNFKITYTTSTGETETTNLETFFQTIGKNGETEPTEGNVSTPRLIVSGFTTNPETIKAGTDFTLTLHITNTSKNTTVKNIVFDLQAPTEGKDESSEGAAFLPKSGSSVIFVDSIAAGATKDVSIDMNSRADLSQKPYVISVNMNYEDSSANAYTSDTSVSIPVKQEAKFDISGLEVMPSSINVGSESNVMFSINNTGKTMLYNVNVTFKGSSISGGDTFIGNIEIGGTGNVDAMVSGAAVTEDEGKVKAIITYEDESGNVSTKEQEFELFVSEATDMEGMDDFGAMEGMDDFGEETPKSHSVSFIIIVIVVIIGILAGAVVAILFLKKKKQKELELLDFDDEAGEP